MSGWNPIHMHACDSDIHFVESIDDKVLQYQLLYIAVFLNIFELFVSLLTHMTMYTHYCMYYCAYLSHRYCIYCFFNFITQSSVVSWQIRTPKPWTPNPLIGVQNLGALICQLT